MNLAKITEYLVGQGYELGKMDCFALTIVYLEMRGVKIPGSFRGYTMESYKDLYIDAPVLAKEIMVDCMASITEEIPVSKAFAGDILLLRYRKSPHFFGIDGGNGNVLLPFEDKGVRVVPLKQYTIERAYRCPR